MLAIGTRAWLERSGGKLASTDRLMTFADGARVRAAIADVND